MPTRFDPAEVGWRIGKAHEPRGGDLWCPWDRTAGVIGPQGSGKTLDLLTPALLAAPGAALVTLTKVDDLLLTIAARTAEQPARAVLDPFGLADGLPELVWDPIVGCDDPITAERRAKAFGAGIVQHVSQHPTAVLRHGSTSPRPPRCCSATCTPPPSPARTSTPVLRWVANPQGTNEPAEILLDHPERHRSGTACCKAR